MTRVLARLTFALAASLPLLLAPAVPAAAAEPVPLYKLVRSLQGIQDSIVRGEIDAIGMQRFLLNEIDKRLRNADMSVFEDTRNVDAALIYAMSGGNPETLDFLADRDVAGNFDTRITSILRRYLNGRGAMTLAQVKEVVPEYRHTAIGPYLELIGANALMEKDRETALRYFDWARLSAPGTIVEEAALRRALFLTTRKGDSARALPYLRRYARRFMNSPYASQFADIFVGLVLDNPKALPPTEVSGILSLTEPRKRREIYLRLARRAAIFGNHELAAFAADEAKRLSDDAEPRALALAELYSAMVSVPNGNIDEVMDRLQTVSDEELPPKDRFLRQAAEIIVNEVVAPPSEESLTQVRRARVDKEYRDRMSELARTAKDPRRDRAAVNSVRGDDPDSGDAATRQQALDARILETENFVGYGRSKLLEIDALLNESDQP